MLHKDYNRKSSVAKKISGRESQGACRQDELIKFHSMHPVVFQYNHYIYPSQHNELIGGKLPVVK
jgi:hypothetical protein